MIRHISFIIVGLIFTHIAYSQDNKQKENTGDIEDVEVQIIKDREIVLLKADRNFEKASATSTPVQPAQFEYQFKQFDFSIPDLTFKLRPLRIKSEQLSKLYGGYLKAGYGNYNTPYLEGYINNKRDQQYSYGANIKHLSSKKGPVDDENSGISQNHLNVFGKIFSKKVVLGGDIGYMMNKVHFYGYPDGLSVEADDIRQQIDQLKIRGYIKSNHKDNKPAYQLHMSYRNASDDFEAREGLFTSGFSLTYPLSKESSLHLKTNVQAISRSDANISDNRLLFSAQPVYQFVYNEFDIQAGLNMAYENDTLKDLGKFHLYPVVNISYEVNDNVELYAGLDGSIIGNTYHSVIKNTPLLAADVSINHTNQRYRFAGGMRARTGQYGYAHAGFTMAGYQYYQYFTNDPTDNAKFIIGYDPETTTVANIFGEWGISKLQQLQLSLRADYYIYNTGSIAEPFHQPKYKLAALAKYNLYHKIIIESKLHMIGGITALDTDDLSTIELDPAVDLSLQGTYKLSDQFSIFLKFSNILSQEYQLWNRYPVRGLQVIGGLSYTF